MAPVVRSRLIQMSQKKWVIFGSSLAMGLIAASTRGDVTIASRYTETTAFAKGFGASGFGEPDGPTVSRTSTTNDFQPFSIQKIAQSDTVLFTTTESSAFQDSSLNLAGSSLISAHASG